MRRKCWRSGHDLMTLESDQKIAIDTIAILKCSLLLPASIGNGAAHYGKWSWFDEVSLQKTNRIQINAAGKSEHFNSDVEVGCISDVCIRFNNTFRIEIHVAICCYRTTTRLHTNISIFEITAVKAIFFFTHRTAVQDDIADRSIHRSCTIFVEDNIVFPLRLGRVATEQHVAVKHWTWMMVLQSAKNKIFITFDWGSAENSHRSQIHVDRMYAHCNCLAERSIQRIWKPIEMHDEFQIDTAFSFLCS